VQEAGIATATQISNVESARRAAHSGIDVIVARGAEGGGHGEPVVGTLPLLEEVLDAVSQPVLAAGGISTGRGLAAVLAAGASGAWMGTAFAACSESLNSEAARTALVQARGTDTVTTSAFDAAFGYPWLVKYPERVLRNELWERWSNKASLLVAEPDARPALARDIARAHPATAHVNAGQGVGNLTKSETASEVINRTRDEALSLLRRWSAEDNE
jgi:nitronate monooxygenase